jgi:hypothetical protein
VARSLAPSQPAGLFFEVFVRTQDDVKHGDHTASIPIKGRDSFDATELYLPLALKGDLTLLDGTAVKLDLPDVVVAGLRMCETQVDARSMCHGAAPLYRLRQLSPNDGGAITQSSPLPLFRAKMILEGSAVMIKASTLLAALSLAASPAFGACNEDTIHVMASDGEILIMSGQMYRVLPGYDFYSKVWLPAETIIICEDALVWFDGGRRMIYAIVNRDENNEHVSAFKGR